MLKVGQVLWWVDHNTKIEGTVTVVDVSTKEKQFSVRYNGKICPRQPFSKIGKTLFYTSQLQKEEPKPTSQPIVKACFNCFYRHSGECTSLRDEICEDYRAKQVISKAEMEEWPEYGAATAFRMQKRKPIKKEKW